MNWFYEYNGEQKGPVDDAELDRVIAQGLVLPTTLVWREGLEAWTPLAQARPGGATVSQSAATGLTQCDSCGQFFDGADLVQIAGRNICAACKPAVLQGLELGTAFGGVGDPGRTGPAWEHKETLGTWAAARDTVKAVLLEPSHTFSTMKVDGGLTNPFFYNLLLGGIGNVAVTIYMLALGSSLSSINPVFAQSSSLPGAGVIGVILRIIWAFVGVAIGAFLQSATVHVCLMICGGARRPFEATFRAVCYGAGSVALLNVIPGLGTLVAIPWALVVTCVGLMKTHETDLWRVILAVFLPAIVCCVIAFAVIALAMGVAGASHH